ncbi:glycogen synthase [Chitinophaga nivalis]|uniref:Glycogen synthase n=1 Tax=Chitinophaga nivalis TaxID=2991709 RepID=A0ABT3INS9_9BACT|nr:glycogen synthase [Chitinophaga nivalis]MCW3464687.1 glycogen synthase [Chitinophaga nivalis]MCW3485622.1 glycogen synthase [Chitinophaga nivalis]
MEILHVSAECYPVAKVGGLGDVVGALPKYQHELGSIAKVVLPAYRTKFYDTHEFDVVHQAGMWLGHDWYHFNVLKERHNALGFDLYLVDIPGLLDTPGVYGYANDTERFLAFQIAVLDWINEWQHQPDVIHCHDHHTGLIPFLLSYGYKYTRLKEVASVLTIHNAQYQGQFGWDKLYLIPAFDLWKSGLLDWGGAINPLAAGIKCAWRVTTVSPGYLEELFSNANGLESLISHERAKTSGIVNGIDTAVWDTTTDPMIPQHYDRDTVLEGKAENKKQLCERFGLDTSLPLISFIGRLVSDKGADLLPEIISRSLHELPGEVNFLVLGSGEPHVEWSLQQTRNVVSYGFNLHIGYNEALSHLIYAGSDFLLMPSRVEPCGLNQLYALRYGTVPMVRSTGGLKDTVVDFGDKEGVGIRFNQPAVWDVGDAIKRAVALYHNTAHLQEVRLRGMQTDHSWGTSAQRYLDVYTGMKY